MKIEGLQIKGIEESKANIGSDQMQNLARDFVAGYQEGTHEEVQRLLQTQLNDEVARQFLYFEEMRKEGRLITACVDGNPIGTTGIRRIGKDKDSQRAIWEICGVWMNKNYEGNKISWRLMDEAEQEILKRDPSAIITIVTDHGAVEKWAGRKGYDNANSSFTGTSRKKEFRKK